MMGGGMGKDDDGRVRQLAVDGVELIIGPALTFEMNRSNVYGPHIHSALRLCVTSRLPNEPDSYECRGLDPLGRRLEMQVKIVSMTDAAYRRQALVVRRLIVHQGEEADEM